MKLLTGWARMLWMLGCVVGFAVDCAMGCQMSDQRIPYPWRIRRKGYVEHKQASTVVVGYLQSERESEGLQHEDSLTSSTYSLDSRGLQWPGWGEQDSQIEEDG